MKVIKLCLVIMAAALLTISLGHMAYAFHSGGVADCEGCHTMHNSYEGLKMGEHNPKPVGQGNQYLLQGSDQSSTCLNCHQHQGDTTPSSYHISTADADMPSGSPPIQLPPGGDFGWVKKMYSWIPRSGSPTEYSWGERHGHNIVAADYGYNADTTNTKAPGGITPYPAANLMCISCHDPHGKYRRNNDGTITTTGKPIRNSGSYPSDGSKYYDPDATFAVGVYRLLGGIGYVPKSISGIVNVFVNNVPAALVPSTYNRSEQTTQTRVAYGLGMSEWCSNCHGNFHNSSYPTDLRHPSGSALTTEVVNNYNAYVKTGDMTGSVSSSYLSLVPVEGGVSDHTVASYGALKTIVNTAPNGGPDGTYKVMCLSCHRAHASGFDSMTRWSNGNEFLTVASGSTAVYPDPSTSPAQAMGRTVAETQKAYYDRLATKFAPYQRSLCNKCHAKD